MNKKKILIAVLAAIMVILTFSNIWFFIGNESLQNQVTILETDKNNLQNTVNQLRSQIQNLQTEKNNLETQISSLNHEIDTLKFQNTHKDEEIIRLNNIIVTLNGWVSDKEAEIEDLYNRMLSKDNEIRDVYIQLEAKEKEINELKAPNLVSIGVGAYDNRAHEGNYNLHVYGWVFNVGHETVESSRMHVTAYYINGTLAIDTYINLGLIEGNCARKIDSWINYEGISLEMSRTALTTEYP